MSVCTLTYAYINRSEVSSIVDNCTATVTKAEGSGIGGQWLHIYGGDTTTFAKIGHIYGILEEDIEIACKPADDGPQVCMRVCVCVCLCVFVWVWVRVCAFYAYISCICT